MRYQVVINTKEKNKAGKRQELLGKDVIKF